MNYEERPTQEVLHGLLRKLVFENRVNLKDAELVKLSKYYIAHVSMLIRLETISFNVGLAGYVRIQNKVGLLGTKEHA